MYFKIITIFAIITNAFASLSDCDTNSIFRPTQLSISPEIPIPGQPIKLTLVFDNTGPEITDGTISTSIVLNGLPLPSSKEPLCANTICPISPGTNDRSAESTWPSGVTGSIKSRVTWTGANGESLLCINSVFKIPSSFSWNPIKLFNNLYKKE